MGQKYTKENLYYYVDIRSPSDIIDILKMQPTWINEPMTTDCQSTPLGRACWNGDFEIAEILINCDANANYDGPKRAYPIGQAVKRRHNPKLIQLLIENGADPFLKCGDNFNALEWACIFGQYQNCLYLIELKPELLKTLQDKEVYIEYRTKHHYNYINVEMYLDYLKILAPFDKVPNFNKKPPGPVLRDPVPDPNEPWGEWLQRTLDFEPPKMVERSSLPLNQQPQNQFSGKMRIWINKLDPTVARMMEEREREREAPSDSQLVDSSNSQVELQHISIDTLQQSEKKAKKMKKLGYSQAESVEISIQNDSDLIQDTDEVEIQQKSGTERIEIQSKS